MDLTINEVALKLNVSKQCIYNRIKLLKNELYPHISVKNGIKYINETGIEIINSSLNSLNDSNLNPLNSLNSLNIDDNIISFYKSEIDYLKKQHEIHINNLMEQLKHLQKESLEKNKLLENMQVLLKDQKLLLEPKKKSKWKFWKS